tara:strand:- start:864 stop:1382 length:519 start_codon:yes stop_codon:yes gene_type:complete
MPISKSEAIFYNDNLIPESIDDVLNIHAQKWIEKLRASLQSNNKVATGSLESSMIPVVDSSPNYVSVTILSNKYGKFVDKGVSGTKVKYNTPYSYKTKQPPVSVIKQFMANRGIVPREGNTPEAITSLAFLIARSIKKKGLKPTKFVSEAIGDDEIAALKKDIIKAIKKGLK